MDPTTLIGIVGAFLILVAFILNQIHKWDEDDLIYDFINFAGSLFLIIYSVLLKSFPFIILNFVWGLFSLKDIIIELFKKKP